MNEQRRATADRVGNRSRPVRGETYVAIYPSRKHAERWMEEDFGRTVAERMANAGDEDEHEVEILNHERGEVVGTIDTDGNLDTESEALRNVSQEYIEEGIPVLVPTTYENEDGETVHADAEVMVEPGTTGFVRAFVDELPSPFDCELASLASLPVHDLSQN